jgi:hypothetical protein
MIEAPLSTAMPLCRRPKYKIGGPCIHSRNDIYSRKSLNASNMLGRLDVPGEPTITLFGEPSHLLATANDGPWSHARRPGRLAPFELHGGRGVCGASISWSNGRVPKFGDCVSVDRCGVV